MRHGSGPTRVSGTLVPGRGGSVKHFVALVLLAGALSYGGCQCGAAVQIPPNVTSVSCACNCGAFAVTHPTPRFEFCLSADQEPADGGTLSKDQILQLCQDACAGGIEAAGQEVGCFLAPIGPENCSNAGCGTCNRTGDETFFTPGQGPDGGFTIPNGGLIGPTFERACLDDTDAGQLRGCAPIDCVPSTVFAPVCGDAILEGGERCDTECSFRSCADEVQPRDGGVIVGTIGCAADCSAFDTSGCIEVAVGTDAGPSGDKPPCPHGSPGEFLGGTSANTLAQLRQCTVFEQDTPGPTTPACLPPLGVSGVPADNGNRPTKPLCILPQSDPPEQPPLDGPMSPLISRFSEAVIDPTRSSITLFPAGGPSAGIEATVYGNVDVDGRPCPSGGCGLGINLELVAAPISFNYSLDFGLGLVPTGSVEIAATSMSAQTTPEAIVLGADGSATLPPSEFTGTTHAHVVNTVGPLTSEQDLAFFVSPTESAIVHVDYLARTFSLSGTFSTPQDLVQLRPAIDATFDIKGTISSTPPIPDAGGDQTIKCSDAAGTLVTLDGSGTTDLDGDLAGVAWYRGHSVAPADQIATTAIATVMQPIGDQIYTLRAVDDRLQVDFAWIAVSVLPGRPPVAAIAAPTVAECSSPAGALVHLSSAGSTDPDGRALVGFSWHLDSAVGPLIASGADAEVQLSLGSHEVFLTVTDTCGLSDTTSASISVVDTTPPVIVSFAYNGPMCLWPPNHSYFVLDLAASVDALITDACDPNPHIEFSGGTVNQPDNGLGDGNTVNDLVVFPDHACLRAERQGTVLEGREYTLDLLAVDASGNTADPTIVVAVEHDQGNAHTCNPTAAGSADDDDPRCLPAAPAATASTSPREDTTDAANGAARHRPPAGGASCAEFGGMPSFAGLAILLVLFSARRRILLAGFVALGVCSGCGQPPPPSVAVVTCVRDVWQTPLPLDCENDCGGANPPRECASTDCEIRGFLWLRSDDTSVQGFFRSSRSLGIFSSSAGVLVKQYTLSGDTLTISPQPADPVKCNASELDWHIDRWVRSPRGSAASFEAAFQATGWTAQPYLK